MTYPVIPAHLGSCGIVKESSYGAGGIPAMLIPFTSVSPPDDVGLLSDAGWRGAPADAYQDTAGPLDSTIELGGPVYADSIGYAFAGILGDVSFSAGSPNTWTMALLNSGTQQPPSYEVTVNDPIGNMQYAGCRFASVQLTFDPTGILQWKGKLAGLVSTTSADPMPAPSGEVPFPAWSGMVTIGGTTETRLLGADLTWARQIVAKRNVTGQQSPYLQRSDVLALTGQLTFALSSDTYHQAHLAATSTTLDLNFSKGAGAALRQLVVHCSSLYFTSSPRDYGKKWIELIATFKADHNATDVGASGGYSPSKITLKNAVGSGTYA
jgi:hypothetical protein